MVKHLAYGVAQYLNYFPTKNGVSKQFSTRMILHQEAIDYKKQCAYAFGTYVQTNMETQDKNNNHPQTPNCIYLRPTMNHKTSIQPSSNKMKMDKMKKPKKYKNRLQPRMLKTKQFNYKKNRATRGNHKVEE